MSALSAARKLAAAAKAHAGDESRREGREDGTHAEAAAAHDVAAKAFRDLAAAAKTVGFLGIARGAGVDARKHADAAEAHRDAASSARTTRVFS